MRRTHLFLLVCVVAVLPVILHAQGAVPSARVAILLAEYRRAATPAALTTLRRGVGNRDPQTARMAVRALGRLERPALIPDLIPALRSAFPEVRAEAANAIGQAAQGWKTGAVPAGAGASASVLSTLTARLAVEEDTNVRAVICATLARLPHRTPDDVERAESALLDLAARSRTVNDRLGIAKGLEALVRIHGALRPLSRTAIELLRVLAGVPEPPLPRLELTAPSGPDKVDQDPFRDSRVRRLSVEALTTAESLDEELLKYVSGDVDAQVRRVAMRGAARQGVTQILTVGLGDPSPIVRLEALRALHARGDERICEASITAAGDRNAHVALLAFDQLADCGSSPVAVALLQRTAASVPVGPRSWHRPAHALVALASAAPGPASEVIDSYVKSTNGHLRVYGARAAALLNQNSALAALAVDPDDNVAEAAIQGLMKVGGHASDRLYIAALGRSGSQVVHAAAVALDGTPDPASAIPALQVALERLTQNGDSEASDTRLVLIETLTRMSGTRPATRPPRPLEPPAVLNAAELRRLAAPRARITLRALGTFELVLFTSEAPATVLRFVELAQSGYYNGASFHRVVPNSLARGGSPGGNDRDGLTDPMRDELGLWPHVRGAVGLAARGRDTGKGQFFINLIDNAQFDHEYTVFAQVLNGLEVVDQILEGDVIDRIDILL